MRHSVIAAGILVALIGAGLPAQTTQSVTSMQQAACYVPGSGTVYRIRVANTPSQCSAGHVEFQLVTNGKPGSGGASGAAGGDLSGDYPNPIVSGIQGQPVSATAPAAGQVLTYSNGGWAPQAPAAATLPTTNSGAYDFSNINGFLSIGTEGSGFFPMNGAGTRLMWLPVRSAFRAGRVDGTQWDNGQIGIGSVAMGVNTRASGYYSVALGNGNVASADYTVAIGVLDTASALGAVALGMNTNATGNASTALGSSTVASGSSAVAMGSATVASGSGAFAMGSSVTASANYSTALGRWASTNGHPGAFVYGDATGITNVSAVADNQFVVRAQGIWLGTTSTPTATAGRFIETSTGAYLSSGGTWTNSSDVNRKHAFASVDGEAVLEKLAAMPVSTWSYKTESDSVRHMGPTAQDFRAAFGLGDTEKAIATVDADGVAFAAIKVLIQRTTEQRAENAELRAELADIQRRLSELQASKP